MTSSGSITRGFTYIRDLRKWCAFRLLRRLQLINPSETWLPGRRVGGCVLVEPLASGSMGEVWLAVREGAHGFRLPVAIKRLHAGLTDERATVRMFLDEGRLLSTLSHPSVVRVLDVGEESGAVFAVLEFVEGETLASLTRKVAGPLTPTVAVSLARSLGEALHYVHTRPEGIVHRDVTPRNVLVTREGGVKLLDFGIARSALRSTQTEAGALRGTLAYMAPEQARGEALDGRADQFALSVMLFEWLTGTRLYGERSELELLTLVAAREGALPDVRSRGAVVPEELARIVDRGLSRAADARYPSMREFIDALVAAAPSTGQEAVAQLLASVSPPAVGPKRWDVAPVPTSRSPVRWFVGAAVLLAIAGASWWSSQRTPPPPVVSVVERPAPIAVVVEEVPVVVDAGIPRQVTKAKPARLTLKTVPWTYVYLGRKLLGETPLVDVTLPAGTHQLRLANEELGIATSVEVRLVAGETKTLSLHLQ